MKLTKAAREGDGGKTEVTISEGFVHIDIFRNDHLVERYRYQAKDLVDKKIDRLLISSGITWSDFKSMIRRK